MTTSSDPTARRAPSPYSWLTDSLLFISSYAPAFAALALRFECPRWLPWLCIALAALGVVATIWFLVVLRLFTRDWATLEVIEDKGGDVGGYFATYLLPLIVVSTPTVPDMLAYLIVFVSLGLIFVRSRLIFVNPMFYLFWYRLFYVQTNDGFAGYILTKRELRAGDRVRIVQRDRLLLDMGEPLGD